MKWHEHGVGRVLKSVIFVIGFLLFALLSMTIPQMLVHLGVVGLAYPFALAASWLKTDPWVIVVAVIFLILVGYGFYDAGRKRG